MTPSQIKRFENRVTRLETKLQIKPAKLKGKMDEGKREKKYDKMFGIVDEKTEARN